MTDLQTIALQGDRIILESAIDAVQAAHDARRKVQLLEQRDADTGRRRAVADARVEARRLEGHAIDAIDSAKVRSAVTIIPSGMLKLVAAHRIDTVKRDHEQTLIILKRALALVIDRKAAA